MASYTTLGFQVAVLFGIVYAWFYNGVPGVWKQISTSDEAEQLLNRLQLKASGASSGGQFENPKEFATVAAVTHTAVLLLGFALSTAAVNIAQGLGGNSPQRSLLARFLKLPVARWTAFGFCVSISFAVLHAFFRWSFENRVGITYRMAAQFFYERDGSSPFALMSTTSYVMFFAAGFAIKQLFPTSSGVDGIFPAMLMRWMPRLVKSFLVAMIVFHFAVMPAYDSVVKPVIKNEGGVEKANEQAAAQEGTDFTHHFALLASLSHTAALALGVVLCCLARQSVGFLASLQPSRLQVFSLAKGAVNLTLVLSACAAVAFYVRWYTDFSLDAVALMWQVTRHWCWTQLALLVESHASLTSRLATFLGLDAMEAAQPMVFVSFAIWFAIGLASEYSTSPKEMRETAPSSGPRRPIFTVGPMKIYPVSKATCDMVGWLLPLGFTLVGLAHQHTALFYDSLVKSFVLLLATVLPGAMLVQAFCMRFGRKIQHEKSAPPLFWEEATETIGAMFMIACFMAWPVTKYRSGQRIALNWTLEQTGDSLWFYIVVKLVGGIFIADCWNYWKHRALHWRMLYVFHKDHHSFYDPSCFASFAIHPFEALLTFWQIMLFSIADLNLWGPVHVSSLVLLAVMNLYLHCGYAVSWLESSLPWCLLNTSRFHNVHHEVTRAHFGEILFVWDWLCGTAIDRRLDDHPVIADMFEYAPYTEDRKEMRRQMDAMRGVPLAKSLNASSEKKKKNGGTRPEPLSSEKVKEL